MFFAQVITIALIFLFITNLFLAFYFVIKWYINYERYTKLPFYKVYLRAVFGHPVIKYTNLSGKSLSKAKEINKTRMRFIFLFLSCFVIVIILVGISFAFASY